MSVYAIGDLHFSGMPPRKPMDIFGEHWRDHRDKVIRNWTAVVAPDDWVVLCGDLSWGMKLSDALPDLEAVAALPGHKVVIEGNHDYWWTSVKKMTEAMQGAFAFLRNSFQPVETGDGTVALCGSRGWPLPGWENFDPAKDRKILDHEVLRVRASLEAARKAGCRDIILALHYPPFYTSDEASPFYDLIEEFGVRRCVFGHIHGEEGAGQVFQGRRGACTFRLVSCDTNGFTPVRIG